MNDHHYLWIFLIMLTFLDLLLFSHMWAGGLLSGSRGAASH